MKTQSKAELALCCAGVSNPLFSSPRQFVILISQSFSNAGLPTIPASQSAWNNWLAASGLLTFFEGAKEPLNLSEVHLPPADLSPDLQERKKKRSQQLDLTKELQRSRNGREKLPLPQYLPMWTVSLLNVTQSLLWSASGPLKTSQWNWALHLMERPFWLNKCISIKKKNLLQKLIAMLILEHMRRKETENVSHSSFLYRCMLPRGLIVVWLYAVVAHLL